MAQEYQKQSGEFPKITILNAHELDMVGITKEFHKKYEPLSYTRKGKDSNYCFLI